MKPRVLVYDIETAPMLGYVWSLWENNVALNQLHTDWQVLSWAAKWLDDDKVYYGDQREGLTDRNEKTILKALWKMLDEADVVITHNGKSFDEKKLNARFLAHGLGPLGKKVHIDTKQIASRVFKFTSNKLEYLTDKFCVEHKKLKHAKFPGFLLWAECLKGNQEAWNEMAEYNIADVESLEELYHKLQPWDNTINFAVFDDDIVSRCNCGSATLRKKGYRYTKTGKFQRYICESCGRQTWSKKNLHSKAKRKSLQGV